MIKKVKQRVMLHDELSRIGSGYRHVIVATGTKWAHIQCVVTGVKQRMKLTKWKGIERGMHEYRERNQ